MANAKAQLIGQVFIFILAGLVFILILAYGYQAINTFLAQQEQVIFLDFHTNLASAVENVKQDFGSVRKIHLLLPKDVQGVCFIDDNCSTVPQLQLAHQTIFAPWAQDACKKSSSNVFFIPRTSDEPHLDITLTGALCIPNVNGLTLKLEGVGKKAAVSPWTT